MSANPSTLPLYPGPADWRGPAMRETTEWLYVLDEAERAELLEAARYSEAAGVPLTAIGTDDFPLPTLGASASTTWNERQFPGSSISNDPLDPLFELSNVGRVKVQAVLVGCAQVTPKSVHLAHDPVQDRTIGREALSALLRSAACPEELFKDRTRVADHRQRLCRRCP